MAGEPTAALAPAWANAETGFLGSGWSNDGDEPADEPRGRRGRRKSGRGGGGDDVLAAPAGAGKGRVALLSVAAVAVVLGGTVAGVKFMSSGDPAKCEGTTCAAVQATSSQPGPAVSDPAEEDSEAPVEDEPAEEAAEDGEPAETPTPTASSNVRTPPRATSASPTPTPSKSKTKKPAEPEDEETEDPPVEESVSETPTEEASTLDDSSTDSGAGSPGGSTPEPTSSSTFGSSGGSAGSVNVQQTIKQRIATYSANLTLSNTSAQPLQNPTVSVPVDGRVTGVDGAEWTQDGDLLILDLTASIAAGASVEVTFTATGRGSQAQNCGLVEGECVVS
uniref:CBM2 domain-containing protein n=1 Tax=Nonomuraea gerenzanensis TaxID=93944 RepID=A0A1M4ENJ4_9ACTN|nr:hypothetical protein BN4615_P9916 [Nonomuraea gerenzanensis]